MRWWAWVIVILVGWGVIAAVSAGVSSGRDHTGETVRASQWAQAVCGTTGAWEGDLEAIRDEISKNNYAARQNDGGTGDSVEGNISIREGVDRAIRATTDVLQEGIKRAGIPDASQGEAASALLRSWAEQTEENLRLAKTQLKVKPESPAEAFANLGPPVRALAISALQGREAFRSAAALDPEIADAIDGSRHCRDLMREDP
jgi:hypothetical protein